MKSQSKLLKVVSILLIIFGVIGLISNVGIFFMSGSLADVYEAAGVAAPTTMDYVISIAAAVAEIAAGILGVMYRNRQAVLIAGLVYTALLVISMIMTAVSTGFSVASLLSLVLPLLYLWGWYQSN